MYKDIHVMESWIHSLILRQNLESCRGGEEFKRQKEYNRQHSRADTEWNPSPHPSQYPQWSQT